MMTIVMLSRRKENKEPELSPTSSPWYDYSDITDVVAARVAETAGVVDQPETVREVASLKQSASTRSRIEGETV
jgi:hypothetical protein